MGNWLELQTNADGSLRLQLFGNWRLNHIKEIAAEISSKAINSDSRRFVVDGKSLDSIDTSSAALLLKSLGVDPLPYFVNFSTEHMALLELVASSYKPFPTLNGERRLGVLGGVGESSIKIGNILRELLSFVGETWVEMFRTFASPHFFRLKEFFSQLEQVGVNAVPIVSLVTFLIGVVVAYLFGIQSEKYGANVFVADAAGIAMCRELSPILVAIILAGRSGSAFTAQIGTMKLNEEVDAMLTLGLSPMRVLVLPRVFALMLAMPLLVFVGDIMGIFGSMIIADLRMGITSATFLERLQAVLQPKHFYVGICKAPVFALFIAVIGCHLGLTVENNARSVGINTTATVVRSIVAVILLNAAFAILLVELKI